MFGNRFQMQIALQKDASIRADSGVLSFIDLIFSAEQAFDNLMLN